jgi:hypothetical protein
MEDNVYTNIMFILKNLKLKGLEIEEIYKNDTTKNTKTKIKELFATKKIDTFKSIIDPMQWQKQQRDEWS